MRNRANGGLAGRTARRPRTSPGPQRPKQPSAKQLAYLRPLANRIGQTFAPRTAAQASAKIRRLRPQRSSRIERERELIADAIARGPHDGARVMPTEITGHGSFCNLEGALMTTRPSPSLSATAYAEFGIGRLMPGRGLCRAALCREARLLSNRRLLVSAVGITSGHVRPPWGLGEGMAPLGRTRWRQSTGVPSPNVERDAAARRSGCCV